MKLNKYIIAIIVLVIIIAIAVVCMHNTDTADHTLTSGDVSGEVVDTVSGDVITSGEVATEAEINAGK